MIQFLSEYPCVPYFSVYTIGRLGIGCFGFQIWCIVEKTGPVDDPVTLLVHRFDGPTVNWPVEPRFTNYM